MCTVERTERCGEIGSGRVGLGKHRSSLACLYAAAAAAAAAGISMGERGGGGGDGLSFYSISHKAKLPFLRRFSG